MPATAGFFATDPEIFRIRPIWPVGKSETARIACWLGKTSRHGSACNVFRLKTVSKLEAALTNPAACRSDGHRSDACFQSFICKFTRELTKKPHSVGIQ